MNNGFDNVYDEMTHSFSNIESMMGDLYSKLQTIPDNRELRDEILRLGDIGLGILDAQISLTESYADNMLKEQLLNKLESKRLTFKNALNDTRGSGRGY